MGTQLTIQQLVNEIENKGYILPEFQRGYVWTRDKVRGYLSSLYRGYPTGSCPRRKMPS